MPPNEWFLFPRHITIRRAKEICCIVLGTSPVSPQKDTMKKKAPPPFSKNLNTRSGLGITQAHAGSGLRQSKVDWRKAVLPSIRLGEVERLGPRIVPRKASVPDVGQPRRSATVLPRDNLSEGVEMARTEGFGSGAAVRAADDTWRRLKSSVFGGRLVGFAHTYSMLMRLGRRWCGWDVTRGLPRDSRGSRGNWRWQMKRRTKGILCEAMLLALSSSRRTVFRLRGGRKARRLLLRLLIIRRMRSLGAVGR